MWGLVIVYLYFYYACNKWNIWWHYCTWFFKAGIIVNLIIWFNVLRLNVFVLKIRHRISSRTLLCVFWLWGWQRSPVKSCRWMTKTLLSRAICLDFNFHHLQQRAVQGNIISLIINQSTMNRDHICPKGLGRSSKKCLRGPGIPLGHK